MRRRSSILAIFVSTPIGAAKFKEDMQVIDVEHRIAEIAAQLKDWEEAHRMEDQLYNDVLAAIAAGASNGQALAAAALKSAALEFPRKFT